MSYVNRNVFNFGIIFALFLIDRLSKLAILNLSDTLGTLEITITSF